MVGPGAIGDRVWQRGRVSASGKGRFGLSAGSRSGLEQERKQEREAVRLREWEPGQGETGTGWATLTRLAGRAEQPRSEWLEPLPSGRAVAWRHAWEVR
ncbi:hypothetical protein Ahu01nite_030740 [Winogradskya humida]|uniref:Uncharacterized protein n=1 Tax=Winogradskya humida TaxID=113566 RepID=A0ABQ3ZP72_9ACTN|nr:hypothetical protein Ahu01nite_030740 [Actinoplanes humidus]